MAEPEVSVEHSILQSTKKLIGLDASDDSFDLDILTHINSAFATLYQAGVGPLEGYQITDKNDIWAAFIGNDMHINSVKTYVYLQVKMDFDPPSSGFGGTAIEKRLAELIWRLNVEADFTVVNEPLPEEV